MKPSGCSSQVGLGEAAVDGDEMAGGDGGFGAADEEDGFGAIFGIDGDVGEGALGVEGGSRLRRSSSLAVSSKAMLYFVSEALTRSRGNMVEPLTTVAGLMPLTRSRGA